MTLLEISKHYGDIRVERDDDAPDAAEKLHIVERLKDAQHRLAKLNPRAPEAADDVAEIAEQIKQLRARLGRDRVRLIAPPRARFNVAACVGCGDTKAAAVLDASIRLGRA